MLEKLLCLMIDSCGSGKLAKQYGEAWQAIWNNSFIATDAPDITRVHKAYNAFVNENVEKFRHLLFKKKLPRAYIIGTTTSKSAPPESSTSTFRISSNIINAARFVATILATADSRIREEGRLMVSSVLSRVSAFILFIAGVTLLFAPDVVLPAVISGFPTAAVWLGQLLAGAWLGLAALNWLQRSATLGGIYGRPTVFANLMLYFISALSLLRALLSHGAPPTLWLAAAGAGILSGAYGALLLYGPFGAGERSVN